MGLRQIRQGWRGTLMLAANGRKPTMNANGADFLKQSASSCPNPSERRCSRIAFNHGLDAALSGADLILLYRAAFLAALCNIAFNGSCSCSGEIKPEGEPARRELEQAFMAVRDALLACGEVDGASRSSRRSDSKDLAQCFCKRGKSGQVTHPGPMTNLMIFKRHSRSSTPNR